MAGLIVALLFFGVAMVTSLAHYHALVALHRPLGIAILVPAVLRIVNRWRHPPPALPANLPGWQRQAAHALHLLLYALMLGLPLIGWAMLPAAGYPIGLAGALVLPSIPHQGGTMRYPDLELDLLRAFVAVAETGSFTAAADVVHRSQSAVSQKVLRLEEILGRRVFERTSRMLGLTPDGERLLVAARQMLEFNDRFLRSWREPAASGTLRLGVSEDFIPGQLPKLLARFGRLYPDVHIVLMTGLSCNLLEAYDADRVDAVIVKRSGAQARGRVIWREPLVWLASADYQLDFTKPARLVMLAPPCSYRESMIAALDSVRRDWVAACTASSLMGVQAAVAGGLGVTLLGRSFVQEGMQILRAPDLWPALPMTEVSVLGEDRAPDLVEPLITFLSQSLASHDGLTLAA